MGLLGRIFGRKTDELDDLIKNGSYQELQDAYDSRRIEWAKNGQNGTGMRTPEMERINDELTKRYVEKCKREQPGNPDPNYRWTDANRWED